MWPSLLVASALTESGSGTSCTGSARCAWRSSSSCALSSTSGSAVSSTEPRSSTCALRNHSANDSTSIPIMPVGHEVGGLSLYPLSLTTTSCIHADPPASSSAPSPRTEPGGKGRENFSAGPSTVQDLPKTQALRVSHFPLAHAPEPRRRPGHEAGHRDRPKRHRRSS